MLKKFSIRCLAFFIPVVLGYLGVEWLTAGLNSGYGNISEQLQKDREDIEVMILGSSQMKDAVNPDWLSMPAVNLASGNQHHNTDFKILKKWADQLPRLKTVVLEVSYSHFEIPHNPPDFWKNPIFLKYYGVNAFERPVWFKDRLIYLSNPPFYAEKIVDQYIHKKDETGFNRYGFDTLNYGGLFKDLNYDKEKIAAERKFKINRTPRPDVFKANSALFLEMLKYIHERDLEVYIVHVPMYDTYLPRRNPDILKRRDSIIAVVRKQYPDLVLIDFEEQSLGVKDYWNQSHLNPDGAEIFSEVMDELLQDPDFKLVK